VVVENHRVRLRSALTGNIHVICECFQLSLIHVICECFQLSLIHVICECFQLRLTHFRRFDKKYQIDILVSLIKNIKLTLPISGKIPDKSISNRLIDSTPANTISGTMSSMIFDLTGPYVVAIPVATPTVDRFTQVAPRGWVANPNTVNGDPRQFRPPYRV
jgi:hypothetical protein